MRTSMPCNVCGGAGRTISDPCPNCKGRSLESVSEKLTVTIPAGVEDGTALRVGGKGSDGLGLGRPGDLYVVVRVANDPKFERHGRDLVTVIKANFAQVVLGDEVEMDGLTGVIKTELEPGTSHGSVIRIKGEGLPRVNGTNRGDLLARVEITIPKKLNDEQADLLRKFAELRGERVPLGPQGSGFLGGLFGKKKK